MNPLNDAPGSFKCQRCGTEFTARGLTSDCPICGLTCSPRKSSRSRSKV